MNFLDGAVFNAVWNDAKDKETMEFEDEGVSYKVTFVSNNNPEPSESNCKNESK